MVFLRFTRFKIGEVSADRRECIGGYLAVIDGYKDSNASKHTNPGYFCGEIDMPKTLISETPKVKIIFYSESYNEDSYFQFSTEIQKRDEHFTKLGQYHKLHNRRGRLVEGSYCDRVFEDCSPGHCYIQSPGFPEILGEIEKRTHFNGSAEFRRGWREMRNAADMLRAPGDDKAGRMSSRLHAHRIYHIACWEPDRHRIPVENRERSAQPRRGTYRGIKSWYPANTTCSYIFSTPHPNDHISLEFVHFRIDRVTLCKEYIRLFDGSESDPFKLMNILCDTNKPMGGASSPGYVSTGPDLLVQFTSLVGSLDGAAIDYRFEIKRIVAAKKVSAAEVSKNCSKVFTPDSLSSGSLTLHPEQFNRSIDGQITCNLTFDAGSLLHGRVNLSILSAFNPSLICGKYCDIGITGNNQAKLTIYRNADFAHLLSPLCFCEPITSSFAFTFQTQLQVPQTIHMLSNGSSLTIAFILPPDWGQRKESIPIQPQTTRLSLHTKPVVSELYCSILVPCQLLSALHFSSNLFSFEGNKCNQNVDVYETVTEPPVTSENRGKPLYCSYRIRIRPERSDWMVFLRFTRFKIGEVSADRRECIGGYLAVIDGYKDSNASKHTNPGYFCGEIDMPKTLISETPKVKIIFYSESYNEDSYFQFSTEIQKRDEHFTKLGQYHKLHNRRGRLVEGSYCDRVFEDCSPGHCYIQSPGFP
ncbi:Zinc metalloproteinase nas-39-like protein, partial [Dinothrombium tinctorium]